MTSRRTAWTPAAFRSTKYEPAERPSPIPILMYSGDPVPTPLDSYTRRPAASTTVSRQAAPAGTTSVIPAPPRVGFGATDRLKPRPGSTGRGTPNVPGIVYQGAVAASRRTNASRLSATVNRPVVDGCVPSLEFSSRHAQVSPSERAFKPSAHRYGPHDSHGATTAPFAAS